MIGDQLVAQQHAMRSAWERTRPYAGGQRSNAVAVMIGHDQASGAGPECLLDEPVEWAASAILGSRALLEYVPEVDPESQDVVRGRRRCNVFFLFYIQHA